MFDYKILILIVLLFNSVLNTQSTGSFFTSKRPKTDEKKKVCTSIPLEVLVLIDSSKNIEQNMFSTMTLHYIPSLLQTIYTDISKRIFVSIIFYAQAVEHPIPFMMYKPENLFVIESVLKNKMRSNEAPNTLSALDKSKNVFSLRNNVVTSENTQKLRFCFWFTEAKFESNDIISLRHKTNELKSKCNLYILNTGSNLNKQKMKSVLGLHYQIFNLNEMNLLLQVIAMRLNFECTNEQIKTR
jgi:hypothetical protein